MLENDPLTNVLYVDLSKRRFWVKRREDLFREYLGGVGVGIKLLEEECPPGADPLGPENPIVFVVGPLTGLFPLASKTVALFKSPHTGNLGESHAGGRSAIAIRMAGYGAIVIKGKSETPVYLAVHGEKVFFRDASALWGIESSYTVGRILREAEPGSGMRTIMRIGLAGEKKISYATVVTETYRHFGRLGLGAVFGSKNLKALVISGRRSLPVKDHELYRRLYRKVWKEAVDSTLMKKYHDLGTAENVLPLNSLGGLPTRNLLASSFEGAEKLSGERLLEAFLGRRLACAHCPVGCIHIAALREPYEEDPYFYRTRMISYDYEPLYALGSMLGISDTEGFLKLLDKVETWGLDAMSTGVVLAWLTEAQNRGLISEKETGGLKFSWGDYQSYMKAVEFILRRPTPLYEALGKGVECASTIFGGKDFALAFGGNEMPGYHTGPCAHLGYLIGSRHSHLDGAGYSLDQKWPKDKPLTPQNAIDELVKEESWRQILSSLVVCFFARGIYRAELIKELLEIVDLSLSEDELVKLGRKILQEKFKFKKREGFSLDKLRIPRRIFETPTPLGVLSETFFEEALKHAKAILEEKRCSNED
jgi:aldehyde:ferredoxin oxidoreductase